MRNDDGNGRKARRDRGKRKRIAQPKVEGRWEPEFLSHADGQYPAVHEHDGLVLERRRKDLAHPFIVQSVAVHCGKQTDTAEALLTKRTRETRRHVSRRWIEHEKTDEACRVTGDGRGHGYFVAGNARDDRGAGNLLRVQLGAPTVRERVGGAGVVPAQSMRYCGGATSVGEAVLSGGQELQESAGEKVTMSVRDAHGENAIIIGLVSDTHGLIRDGLFEALAGVSQILHAGDVGGRPVLDALSAIAPVLAVYGNVDSIDGLLPASIAIDAGGLSIHVSHGHELGSPAPAKLLTRYPADIIVFGHTHRPLVHRDGARLVVNPGAAGPRRFDVQPTVGILRIINGKAEVELRPIKS